MNNLNLPALPIKSINDEINLKYLNIVFRLEPTFYAATQVFDYYVDFGAGIPLIKV